MIQRTYVRWHSDRTWSFISGHGDVATASAFGPRLPACGLWKHCLMRLLSYTHPATGAHPRAGVLQGDRILDIHALSAGELPAEMLGVLTAGPAALALLTRLTEEFGARYCSTAGIPTDVAFARWEATLAAPVPVPSSLRDFYAFEEHVAHAYRQRGRPVPAAWYEVPVFYFGNPGSVIGPDAVLVPPAETEELDFELEIACVIGRAGRDIASAEAESYIAGYTILNDWSARDIQRQEMSVGLGPAKGKDFATSLGPWLVTPDELAFATRDDRLDLAMIARVNGEIVTEGRSGTIYWPFPLLIARASAAADLRPGDVIGSGTVGNGCLLELDRARHPWLVPGDEVELEIEGLGRLRNRIADPLIDHPG